MAKKCVKEFSIPRSRVVLEVTRAFQAILQSLKALEKKIMDLEAREPETTQPTAPTEPERTYFHTLE